MALNKSYSTLQAGSVTFNEMLKAFGVVTVMNAKVYPYAGGLTVSEVIDKLGITDVTDTSGDTPVTTTALQRLKDALGNQTLTDNDAIKFEDYKVNNLDNLYSIGVPLCELKTLKVANVTEEGPTKTVTGGQYTNPLIKFGKTARFEMQEALGNAMAIQAFNGVVLESFHAAGQSPKTTTGNVVAFDDANVAAGDYVTGTTYAIHSTQIFSGAKTIIGESFFIDQKTGAQVPVKIIFYQVQPDDLFNLTQDAEGDATVFDMNGDLLTTDIKIGTAVDKADIVTGVFYSVIAKGGIGSASGESSELETQTNNLN